MSKTGRITLPAELRRAMDLEGETEFEIEQLEGGDGLVLRPVIFMLREDAWKYTAEDLASIRRGLDDIREGRVRTVTEAELRALADVADE
jgi:bifunctional DNA-binding transcriptional regulator/antitoxin component of YhaV-PrlF toxin-antitoxin module